MTVQKENASGKITRYPSYWTSPVPYIAGVLWVAAIALVWRSVGNPLIAISIGNILVAIVMVTASCVNIIRVGRHANAKRNG